MKRTVDGVWFYYSGIVGLTQDGAEVEEQTEAAMRQLTGGDMTLNSLWIYTLRVSSVYAAY